jgi:flagellar secretion chaperone FliS
MTAGYRQLRKYEQVDLQTAVEHGSPHRIIWMLFDGALARISAAMGHMRRGAVADKGKNLGLASSIIESLRASLDHERGGEIAGNLDRLYEYMGRRLIEGNLRNDVGALEEVHKLLTDLRDTWREIKSQVE